MLKVWVLVKSAPKIGRQVSHHRRVIGGSRNSASSGLIPKEATYVRPPGCFHYCIKSSLHAHGKVAKPLPKCNSAKS